MDRFAEGDVVEQPDPEPVVERAAFDALYERLGRVRVPESVKDALIDVCRTLAVDYDCDETNSLLTDRSFLVKAVKLLRGRALVAGREEVAPSDLAVLEWMTTFRVPPEVHAKMGDVIERAAARAAPVTSSSEGGRT